MTQKSLVTLSRTLYVQDVKSVPDNPVRVKIQAFIGVFVRWDNRDDCTYRILEVIAPESYLLAETPWTTLTFKKSAIVSTQEVK